MGSATCYPVAQQLQHSPSVGEVSFRHYSANLPKELLAWLGLGNLYFTCYNYSFANRKILGFFGPEKENMPLLAVN